MYKKFSDSILLPNLIRIRENLIVAKFELMKILPAKHIIEKALSNNLIHPGVPIVETSSGTFALGLGIVCAELNIPFFIITDPIIDPALEQRLKQLGGKVQVLSDALKNNNPQQVRLNVLKEYLHEHPKAYWTCQYDNLENQNAYSPFSDFLISELGKDFTLVGAVGSGGSTCGTIKSARKKNNIKLIGVDTFGSILFGLKNQKRILRGLGNSVMPKNLDHACFDEVHWVNASDAFLHTRQLNSQHALFCGPTTGATYQVANWIAANNPNEMVVFISADTGHRYQQTVYQDSWLFKNNLHLPISKMPIEIEHPDKIQDGWLYFKWKRRAYHEVMKVDL